ncbi:U3-aranetoxin-Ce1a-like [Argiope bruennichi]|uniref:U3-aranetoxin-Ce1a-like n=1 Tax=Argiope bruennichi TaxID=94029 RepID=UPI002493D6D1|nr:U3-aranetoxin-Ce1a-like [Argiope bruennichi]
MKTFCFLAVAFCLVCFATAELNEKCDSNADCEEGECCVQLSRFLSPKCKPLRKEHEFCMPEPEKFLQDDKYSFMCPCSEGLTCTPKETEKKDGVTIYKNANCKKAGEGDGEGEGEEEEKSF